VPDTRFFTDAHAGKLPALSVVVPGQAVQSEHNQYFMQPGDNWLGDVASAVMNSPEWSSTALFITWDDCGCFYDQVRPGRNPDGTPQGPRIPLVIVSPFAKPGFTDRTPTTFAGILAFTERTFGLPALGVNDARAYDLANAFNFAQRPLAPVRMVTRPVPPAARHIHVTAAMKNDPT
jgi:phospholipase C